MDLIAGNTLVCNGMGSIVLPTPTPAETGEKKVGVIRTWTGMMFNVFDPELHEICIEDIAHGLAMRCRFGGHTKSFHSVAEHCIHMASMAPEHLRLQALLHDASEAYIGDMPTPIKNLLPDFKALEMSLMERIGERFGFDGVNLDPMVKNLDKAALEWEWQNKVIDDTIESLDIERVKRIFLDTYYNIVKHT